MKNNNIIKNTLQTILTEEEVEKLAKSFDYRVKSRKITVYNLVEYLVVASIEQSKSFRETVCYSKKYGLGEISYSGLSRKANDVSYEVMKNIFEILIKKCNRTTKRNLKIDKIILAIDSTTITTSKTQLKWAGFHGQRSGIKLHVQLEVDSYMPTKVEESLAKNHDFPIGEKLINPLCIIVEDRAYGKIEKFDEYVSEHVKQSFVIRIKENVTIVQPKALKRLILEESNVIRDITCRLGKTKTKSKNRFRVVDFKDDKGNEIRVCTDIMNVTAEVIADIYKARWTIETFFRFIKQNLNLSRIFGTTENSVYNQLFAALITFVITKFLYSKTSITWTYTNLSFGQFIRNLRLNNLDCEVYLSIIYLLTKLKPNF